MTRPPLSPSYVLLEVLSENGIEIHPAKAEKSVWTKCDPIFLEIHALPASTSFDIRAIEVSRKLLSAADQAD